VSTARTFTIGTRGIRLALRQAEIVGQALAQAHPNRKFQIGTVETTGDRRQDLPFRELGQGVFVKELEAALLHGQIDMAVHSLKDMPTLLPEGLAIGAVTEREDVRDAFVSRNGFPLSGLSPGCRVGTGSVRRAAQIRAFRPDVEVTEIRGNVDTRLRKVAEGEVDGVVLAMAGLARLGWLRRATEVLGVDIMLPAVGQGALAVEARADDQEVIDLVAAADHSDTHLATSAERAFLRRLGGGCSLPIAALGTVKEARLHLIGLVATPNGIHLIRDQMEGDAMEAEALGVQLAELLIAQGAAKILALEPR
jgi:hydroxymethylbilane synthase